MKDIWILAGIGAAVWWYRNKMVPAVAPGPQVVVGPAIGYPVTTTTPQNEIIGVNQYGDPVTANGYVAPPAQNVVMIDGVAHCAETSSQFSPDNPCFMPATNWGV